MLHPQIVVHDRDGRLADLLRPLAADRRWALREPRQTNVLWRILSSGGPTALVLKFGDDPEVDLSTMERVAWHLPDVAIVAVGDIDTDPALAGLARDVGAAFVQFPPQHRDLLPEIVAGLMNRAIRAVLPPSAAPESTS